MDSTHVGLALAGGSLLIGFLCGLLVKGRARSITASVFAVALWQLTLWLLGVNHA